MKIDQTILTILLPLVGIALGAYLQSIRERGHQKKTLKIKAYTDYIQTCAQLTSKDIGKHPDAKIALADAKARIAIYGSARVINEIATFDRNGAKIDSEESMELFLRIILSMRHEEMKKKISKSDMARLLFGMDL